MLEIDTYKMAEVKLCVVHLLLCILTVSKLHLSDSKPSGFSLKLIPRDSPESPIYPGNLSQIERIARLVGFTQAKSNYAQFLLSTAQNATLDRDRFFVPLHQDLNREFLFYIAEVGIGTPPLKVNLLLDTGGGLIWTQCEPCKNCYPQPNPLYNSQASSTYRKLPCDHPLCSGPIKLYTCVNGECIYGVSYGGGSSGYTKGVASLESFVFPANGQSTKTIDNIIFGCSNDNQNFATFQRNGQISGIMGINLSPNSLFKQLLGEIGNRFSYCVTPFEDVMPAPSLMRFGDDIPPPRPNIQQTPFYTIPYAFSFYLNLADISVGLHRLNFPPDAFRPIQGGTTSGLFIDSGAAYTVIDQLTNGVNAYEVVMRAFEEYYESKQLHRRAPTTFFRSCYDYQPGFNEFPTLTYHFEGADYVVEGRHVNVFINTGSYFCIGILPGSALSILGVNHMQNMRLIYDGNIGALQFYPEHCVYDMIHI
ncbi:hypothetical protein ACOSP7_030480 [Xanthoceras sorbifolium]